MGGEDVADYDGSIKIDSSLDSSGLEKGLKVAGAAAVAALSAAAASAIKMGADFYEAMSEVQAIPGNMYRKARKINGFVSLCVSVDHLFDHLSVF